MTFSKPSPVLFVVALAGLATGGEIEFNRDIRPILSDKCFHCHGPDKETREAKLRLDTLEGSRKKDAIVPGDLDASEVVYRIITDDEDDIMPPPKSHKELTEKEIALLKQWIKEGAEYEGQWIYEQPVKAAPPAVALGPVHNPIDAFLQARLKKEGRQPADEAERVHLVRRLYFDLTGLPPSPTEVAAFVADESSDAYGNLVERLLQSPAHGERMAVKWLDLVRYADTVGFHGDQNVSQSPYRDYVIAAFNENMPFDRFTREQLGGDLLPNATLSQKVASGYNRLNMTTEEGGAQAKEYLAKYAGDRVRNASVVWLGATLGCAECHDHKFDPYTMKDYYSFAAFFADLEERGVYGARQRPPQIPVPNSEEQAKLDGMDARLAELREALGADSAEVVAARTQWISEMRAAATGEAGPLRRDHYLVRDRVNRGDRAEEKWHYIERGKGPVYEGAMSRVQEGKEAVQHTLKPKAPRVVVEGDRVFAYVYLDPERPPEAVMLQLRSGKEWEHRAYWGADKIGAGGIGSERPAHHRAGDLPATGQWVRLEIPSAVIGLEKGSHITGMSFTQFGGRAWWDDAGISSLSDKLDLPGDLVAILKKEAPSAAEEEKLAAHFRATSPLLWEERDTIANLENERAWFVSTIVTMPVSVSVEPRPIRILPRGNWMDESGEIVAPAIPEFLGRIEPADGGDRLNRLDLANWITSRDNPMTARAFVNNLWHMFFGMGLSNVLSDLGNQGEPPSHPQLLDWLAVEFMDSDWDMRHMVRLIVNSHAYRQSSMPPADLREVDPYNRLVSVQSRRRLDAEMVRDNALKISGLLNTKIGGRSVHPYQPAGYYAQLNFPKRTYQHSTDESQYRRALYSHWQRTFLHPSLMAFDAPAREACTAQRPVSNTPLQALSLMNDPSYVEAARHFGQRIMAEGGATPEERVRWAVIEALSRPPAEREAAVLLSLHRKHLAEYQASPDEAKALLSVGLQAADTDQPAELAAWTSVARAILNLHELITRL